MDKSYIEANGIGLKYLNGQLSEEELEKFEIYMMNNPDIIDELNLDQIMAEGVSASLVAQPVTTQSFMQRLFGHGQLVNALGSFVLGLMVMGVLSMERGPVNSLEIQYLVAQDSVRGSEELPFVEFEFPKASFKNSSNDQFVLVIEPSGDSQEAFSVTINAVEGGVKTDVVFKVNKITTNLQGRVALTVRTSDFAPGEYLVELNSLADSSTKSVNARFKITQRG